MARPLAIWVNILEIATQLQHTPTLEINKCITVSVIPFPSPGRAIDPKPSFLLKLDLAHRPDRTVSLRRARYLELIERNDHTGW